MSEQARKPAVPATAVGTIVGIGPGLGVDAVGPDPGEGRLWLEVGGHRQRATIALVEGFIPAIGDRVVTVADGEDRFVVGVLEASARRRVRGAAGEASVTDDGSIEVRDAEGRLRLRFDGQQTELIAPGDLVLGAPEGQLRLSARDDVVIEAGADISQTARGRLQQRATRLDVEAEQIFEKCRDVVREASALALTRAGRVRAVVRGGYSLLSRRTRIKSEKDTTIDGERILLG